MTPEKYARIRELFFAVYERPPRERQAYLDDNAETVELRAEVETLLAQHDELTTFLDESDLVTLAAEADPGPGVWVPGPGERIGPYVVRRVLGEGGFGMVCEAEQREPVRRTVALKILKTGLDTREVIARFEAERQALAMMDHRFIAKVLDAGATATGRPYFVMEYVPGVPITQFCREQALGVEAKLQLFLQVCEAIEHAHQKGIIHRDIKPSNVLVTVQGERTVPKIIDFGIAKAVRPRLGDRTTFTAQGQLVGTPAYMSPEQADLGTLDIDTRSDIYSLGALLYELLVGVPAFGPDTLHGKGMVEIRRILREQEPVRPSVRAASDDAARSPVLARSLQRRLRGDLDWIVLKAMEKDRSRRYATTRELALDIKRHLAYEPVAAGPPSGLYLLSKFARRHRTGVAASILVVLVLAAGFWAVAWQRARAETQATVASSVIQILGELFSRPPTGPGSTPAVDMGLVENVRELMEEGGAFVDEPHIRARIFGSMGFVYRTLGDDRQAASQWRQSLALRRAALGDEHNETLMNMTNLVAVLRGLGELDEAVNLGREAVAASERTTNLQQKLKAKSELAASLRDRGESEEAEKLLRETLAMQRDQLGSEHVDTLATAAELARLLSNAGKHGDAAELMEEVVRVKHKRNRSDPRTLAAMRELADEQAALGRYAEAARILEEVQTSAGPDDAELRREIEELRARAAGVDAVDASASGSTLRPGSGH